MYLVVHALLQDELNSWMTLITQQFIDSCYGSPQNLQRPKQRGILGTKGVRTFAKEKQIHSQCGISKTTLEIKHCTYISSNEIFSPYSMK